MSATRRSRDTVLATVLFTQIVDSKEHVERLGNARWYALLDRLREHVRKEIEWFRGREIDMIGDRAVGNLRWAGARDTLCTGYHRVCLAAGDPDARGIAHGRV